MPDEAFLSGLVRAVEEFRRESHDIFARQEDASDSRVADLRVTSERLQTLNARQSDMLKQALRCAEQGLFKAAHVMAWAAFMDYLEEVLDSDGLAKLKAERPNWKGNSMEVMREYVTEYQIIDACQPVGLLTKNQVKALHGLLNKRNECAHPSNFFPGLNETLGFISEIVQRMSFIASKAY